MREIRINRPKRMEAAMTGLQVELDGQRQGKLANGAQLAFPADEKAHELNLHGGMLAGKAFSAQLHIPAGIHSYAFQVDMLSLTNGYKPVLRPCGSERLPDCTRTITLIGTTLTMALMDDKLRGVLAQLPQARLSLDLADSQWQLLLCAGAARKAVLQQPYSQTKGSLLAGAINAIEHHDLQTPEGRSSMIQKLFDGYLRYLPDYEITVPNELAFRG
ncbi:MAG: hypothetical protein ACI4ML_05120 [Aristaeellaceae bacterium]